MAGRLDGRVALVTGAASGIGRATAFAFAREGARLVAADIDRAGGEETVRQILGEQIFGDGAAAEFVLGDVTRGADVEAMVARAVERWGRLDCAFNNAGIEGTLRATADYPEDVFARVVDVNLLGVWRCLRAEIPVMVRQGGGAIVNTGSVGGLVGAAGFSAYAATKHAVVGLTRCAAIEYAKAGVRVNAVCPGIIETPMLDRLSAEMPTLREALLAMKPMGRLGTPAEVAEAVVWLCSDAASFVTGHALAVDGGYVAQ
jgi:NAD(P)-dependent dehydrogenase (short-subunit alcohol dehydrogenase family)